MSAATRYLAILATGAALAWVVWRRLPARELERRLEGRAHRVAMLLALAAGVLGVTLLGLRYATWHTHVFDLGSYDQKIWVASIQPNLIGMIEQTYRGGERFSPCGASRYWGICHFQPLYTVYALVYRVWPSPLLLLWSQTLLVVSGVIPCYLLMRGRLGGVASMLGVMIYLLHPAVQFNALVDFRPDHVAIPLLFWAFLLAERNRPGLALVAAALPALAKESLILAFVAFGLFLVARHGHALAGTVAITVGMAAFMVVTFGVLAGSGRSEGVFMFQRYFSGGSELVAPSLVAWKLFYLISLFGPVGFLSWRAPTALLPALPSLGISLLSSDVNHFSIESQYSASVVAPTFAALVTALTRLRAHHQDGALRALAALVVLSAAFSVAQGPTPFGLRFWNERWGQWHFRNYLPDRQAALDEAARRIPDHPDVMVVSQNDVNSAILAHRHYYFPFPAGIDRADYILVDTGRRRPFLYWMAQYHRELYDRIVLELRHTPGYRIAFERDGVVLFQRIGPSHPGVPDPERLPVLPKGLPK
jgi:uncharacterized membrane protein